jgi:hypothetical protein
MKDDHILPGEHVDEYEEDYGFGESDREVFGGEFYGPTG